MVAGVGYSFTVAIDTPVNNALNLSSIGLEAFDHALLQGNLGLFKVGANNISRFLLIMIRQAQNTMTVTLLYAAVVSALVNTGWPQPVIY